MNGRRLLIGVFAIAVITVGYFAVTGWPPVGDGGEGAITRAQRETEPQIEAGDVALTDTDIQDLMQTDFFHKLVTDKEFQKMVVNGSMEKLSQLERQTAHAFAREIARNELQRQLERGEYDRVAEQIARSAEVDKAVLRQMLASEATRNLLARNDLERVSHQLKKAEVQRYLERGEFEKAAQEIARAVVVDKAALEQMLRSEATRNLFTRGDLERVSHQFSKVEIRRYLERGEFEKATQEIARAAVVDKAVLKQMLADEGMRNLLARQDLERVSHQLEKAEIQRYLERGEFEKAAQEIARATMADKAALEQVLRSEVQRHVLARHDIARVSQEINRAEVAEALNRNELDRAVNQITSRMELDRAALQQLLKSDVQRQVLLRQDIARLTQAISRAEVAEALNRNEFDRAVNQVAARMELDRAALQQLLKSEVQRQVLARHDIARVSHAINRAEVTEAISRNELDRAVDQVVARMEINRDALQQVLKSEVQRNVLARHDIARLSQAINRAEIAEAMSRNELDRAVNQIAARMEISRDALQQVLKSEVLRDVISRNEVERMVQVLQRSEFGRALEHPGFAKVVMKQQFRQDMAEGRFEMRNYISQR